MTATPSTPEDRSIAETDDLAPQPLRDGDTSVTADPADDPAQAEWDLTTAVDAARDAGLAPADLDSVTATGDDPDQIPADDDEIPAADLPGTSLQPESQGDDLLVAELGEDGQGDVAPEDL